MKTRSHHSIASVLLFGTAMASCGDLPNEPRYPPPNLQVVVRVELSAPPDIEPGASAQLTMNAIKADGSVENVTAMTHWSTTNSSIAQISQSGMMTGVTRGDTIVRGTFDRLVASAPIFVLPKGTFALRGSVMDSGFLVENATVAVVAGVGTGLEMLTRFGGKFALYGVAGPIQVEVRKAGYRTAVKQFDVSAHVTHDITLETDRDRDDYSGTYTLAISATTLPCSSATGFLPDAVLRRTYTATVTQDVGRLTVTLNGANLIVTNGYGNRFSGFVDPDGSIRFPIASGDLYYSEYLGHFDIVERLGADVFMAGGTAIATGTPDGLTGKLEGILGVSSRTSAPFLPFSAACYSKTHTFEMTRQQP